MVHDLLKSSNQLILAMRKDNEPDSDDERRFDDYDGTGSESHPDTD